MQNLWMGIMTLGSSSKMKAKPKASMPGDGKRLMPKKGHRCRKWKLSGTRFLVQMGSLHN